MSDQKDGYKLVPDADSDQEESVDDVEDGSSGSSQHLQNYPSAAQSSLKGTAVGASESVRIEWKKLTPQEQRVQVLAGRALRRLNERAKLLITVENDSVYGAALALPQVARTAGWSLEYTSLACHSMMFLLTNLLLQGFLLYMLSKELRTLDKFGGQMHLCDFGAHSGECPEGKNCIGPGGTAYTPERLYDWKLWTTRVFVRDSFKALFPDRAEDIEEMVDPGEYGLESYYLRMICCFIFVLGLWPDLAGSWDILALLIGVPTKAEPWIMETNWEELRKREHSEDNPDDWRMDFVRFRVAGVPLHWKIINFFLILCPKMYIWILTVDIGIVFLMETSEIEDMIINCVALAFILNLDELTMSMLPNQTKAILEMLEGCPSAKPQQISLQDDFVLHEEGKRWNWFSPGLYGYIIPARLCFLLAVTAFFLGNYYLEACIRLEDGSWVSKDLHLPRSDSLPFLTFLFEPFPRLFPVDTEEEAAWKFHIAPSAALCKAARAQESGGKCS